MVQTVFFKFAGHRPKITYSQVVKAKMISELDKRGITYSVRYVDASHCVIEVADKLFMKGKDWFGQLKAEWGIVYPEGGYDLE